VPSGFQLRVGSPGEQKPPLKRKPRAKSKPSEEGFEGQEQALVEGQEIALEGETEGQELTHRGPGDSHSRARSKPSYLKDDDHDDHDDLKAAANATATGGGETKPKKARKPRAAKPKAADPLGDIAQELTTAFVEKFKGRNLQPFPAIRGVVRTGLASDVPRNVLAHALNTLGENGMAISGGTLTTELGRMRKAAGGQGATTKGSNDQYLADEMEWALQQEAEEAARQQPNAWDEVPA
jgi:hypothetical protein